MYPPVRRLHYQMQEPRAKNRVLKGDTGRDGNPIALKKARRKLKVFPSTGMLPPRTPRTMVQVEAAGQTYKQVQSFTYLGGTATEVPDMSVEIATRTRACWMHIRRYLREPYDQPKVALSLKTRMVTAEAIEALLYGCITWILRKETLRQTPHRTPPSFASYHRGTAQETRPSDNFVQPCP